MIMDLIELLVTYVVKLLEKRSKCITQRELLEILGDNLMRWYTDVDKQIVIEGIECVMLMLTEQLNQAGIRVKVMFYNLHKF